MSQPSAYDRARIQSIITMYDRMYPSGPDSIIACMQQAKVEEAELRQSRVINTLGVINNNQAGRRQHYTMPSNLYIMLKKQFPTVFKDDLKLFEKDFPVFFKAWK